MMEIVIFYTLGFLLNVDFIGWKFYFIHLYSISALLSYYGNGRIRYYITELLYWYIVLIVSFICTPILLWKTPRNPSTRLTYHMISCMAKKPVRINWVKQNTQVLKKNEGAVIVANHQSTFDILGMFQLYDEIERVSPVMKKSLFYVPIFGIVSYISGCLFIDRSNPASALKTLKTARDNVVRDKRTLYIYPEGTRNTSGTLLPFKKGAFRTAIEAQAPIIPLVLSPYYFIDNKNKTFGEGEIIMSFLEPIPTTGLTPEDTDKLSAIAYDKMTLEYEKLKKLKL